MLQTNLFCINLPKMELDTGCKWFIYGTNYHGTKYQGKQVTKPGIPSSEYKPYKSFMAKS